MSIKLDIKNYCQNCNQFQVDVLEVRHVVNNGYTTDTTILCKHKDRCKTIEEWIKLAGITEEEVMKIIENHGITGFGRQQGKTSLQESLIRKDK